MKKVLLGVAAMCLLSPAIASAQQPPTAKEVVTNSIAGSVEEDTQAALAALEKGEYREAALLLKSAGDGADRLSLQAVADSIHAATPTFQGDDTRFVLANSSTVALDDLLKNTNALERRYTDKDGNPVTVRVFGDETAMQDFKTIKDDTAMLEKAEIQVAQMRGEPALKRKTADGGLSVLMMSEQDHALIELEGDEETVMSFINELENPKN